MIMKKFYLYCMTLKIKVKHLFARSFLSQVVNMIRSFIVLGVDSNIFEVIDIKYVEKIM